MGISKASAQWEGGLKTGKGTMKPGHGQDVTFTAGSRFEGQPQSNPEELLGAAFAGCFSMALTVALEQQGLQPKSVKTSADVRLEQQGGGFTITGIALKTEVSAAGIDAAKLKAIADETKKGCPVGRALSGVNNVTLETILAPS
jgi:osmotically inducible protein OsmC